MAAEESKARILAAAFREFAEYGVAGARVERIAKNAECNKNLIYVYFESKEGLFATVLDRHLADAYAGLEFTADKLPELARRVFDYAHSNPDVYRLLSWATLERTAPRPPSREREHTRKLPLIREQQEAGTVNAGPAAELVLMAVMALATAWSPAFPFGTTANPGSDLPAETVREAIGDMVARIVAPAPLKPAAA
jgi:AcrR family transcriptional regulator